MRPSKRQPDEMRAVTLERGVARHAEGSCRVRFGDTEVFCTASLEERVPAWLRGGGRGWVTAEYGMLPRATTERTRREATQGHQSGRTQEIQRLIGRSLRAVTDLAVLGERQISIDCDVIQADGGTRTAAITGSWVALRDCIEWMRAREMVGPSVLKDHVAAVSAGIFRGAPVLDLDYAEDSRSAYRREFRDDRAPAASWKFRAPLRANPSARKSSRACSASLRAASGGWSNFRSSQFSDGAKTRAWRCARGSQSQSRKST